jgi:hypothetical protein
MMVEVVVLFKGERRGEEDQEKGMGILFTEGPSFRRFLVRTVETW